MRRPNFFIVGAPRCGTTSMYTYLKQHPEIYVSVDKEPHFFGSDLSSMPGTIREEELYLQLFAGAGDRPRVGEGSVWYLSSERAPHEIRAFAPDARILILLRDPVEMARSLYSLYSRTGNEDLPTFEEALAAEPERRQGRRIPGDSYYPPGLLYTDAARNAAKVERYFEVFGRENVHCILFEDFTRDTAAVYRKALEFLGVDPGFEAEFDPKKAAQKVRMQAILQLRRLPEEIRRRMQFKEMKQHESAAPRPPLSAELTAKLRELFSEDVSRLGELLGRDLSAWKGKPSGARLREILESVRVLKKIPPEIRAKHERVESLERKFSRWQKVRVPDLPLKQRPYNESWPEWFADERPRIADALGDSARMIEEDRAFVIHLCDRGRPWMDEQMDLRDYLRTHPEERDRYAELKRNLAAQIDQSFLQYTISKMSMSIEMIDRAREWRAASAARELRAVDDQALVGSGADDAGRSLDLDVEAEQPALRDAGQFHTDRDLLAGPRSADVADVDAGADRGLPLVEQRMDEREAGVLGEADHPRGREDALHVRGSHVGSHGVGGFVGQAGSKQGAGHERE